MARHARRGDDGGDSAVCGYSGPGGAFAWQAGVIGSMDEQECKRKDAKLQPFYEDYAKPWYKNHGC